MGGSSSLIPSMVGNPNQRGYMGGNQSAVIVIKIAPKVRKILTHTYRSLLLSTHIVAPTRKEETTPCTPRRY